MNATKRVVTRVCLGVLALGLLSLTACRLPGDPQGSLDSVSANGAAVTAVGWAFDESDPTATVQVHVYAGDTIVWAGDANGSRPDVADAYPGTGPNHGFEAQFSLPNFSVRKVCAYAINTGDGTQNTQLGCTNVSTTASTPVGELQGILRDGLNLAVGGWVIDPATTGPATAIVTVDGVRVRRILADQDSAAIEPFFPGYGPRHGLVDVFLVPFSQQRNPSTTVCLLAAASKDGSETTIGCNTLNNAIPFGDYGAPTFLSGSLSAVTPLGGGQVLITGNVLDNFDPADRRAVYLNVAQPNNGAGIRGTVAVTDVAGNFSEVIGSLPVCPARVCVTATETYDLDPIIRTIDCRDIVIT